MKFLSQKGFSILQAVLLAGVIGGVSLVAMKQSEQTNKQIRTNQTELAVDDLANQIQANLISQSGCTNTFKDKILAINEQAEISSIKSAKDIEVFVTGKNYLNNQVSIAWILLKRTAENEAVVSFEVTKVGNKDQRGLGGNTTRREIKLKSVWTAAPENKLTSCYSDSGASIDEAVEEVLRRLCPADGRNGIFRIGSSFCETVPQLNRDLSHPEFLPTNLTCKENESLQSIQFDPDTGQFKTECHPVFAVPKTCPDNSLISKNADGSFTCVRATCPKGSIFLGISSEGKSNCLSCPAASTIVRTSGGWECKKASCPVGERFLGFDSSGNINCAKLVTSECTSGGTLVFENGHLVYKCSTPNCSDANTVCDGTQYQTSNGTCIGTKKGDCSDAPNWCIGDTFRDSADCGTCSGTKPTKDGQWSASVATSDTRVKPGATCQRPSNAPPGACVQGTLAMQVRYTKTCIPGECGGAPCLGDSDTWVDQGTSSCQSGCEGPTYCGQAVYCHMNRVMIAECYSNNTNSTTNSGGYCDDDDGGSAHLACQRVCN